MGKSVKDWHRLDRTQELIDDIASDTKLSKDELIITHKGGDLSRFQQGTLMHPDLAIQFAQWLSPRFARQVSRWIMELLNKGTVTLFQHEIDGLKTAHAIELTHKDTELAQKDQSIQELNQNLEAEKAQHFLREEQRRIDDFASIKLDMDRYRGHCVLLLSSVGKHKGRPTFLYNHTQDLASMISKNRAWFREYIPLWVSSASSDLDMDGLFRSYLEEAKLGTSITVTKPVRDTGDDWKEIDDQPKIRTFTKMFYTTPNISITRVITTVNAWLIDRRSVPEIVVSL
jgi:hypothetical protein